MKFSMEKLHVYTLALIAAIIPNIVFLNAIPQPRDSIFFMAFPKGEINYDFFSYSKMMFLIFSTVFLTLIFLWKSYKKIKWQPVYGFLIVYTVLIILSTAISPFRELAIRGLGDRYEGIFTLFAYLLLFFVAYNIAKDKDDRKIVIGGVIAGSVVVGLVGIFQYWGLDIYRTRFMQQIITPEEFSNFKFTFQFGKATIYSSLYNTNFVGSYMVIMLFIAIGLFLNSESKKAKNWSYAYALLMFANWIGCRSRAGIMGGQIIFLFALLLFYRLIKTYKKDLIILVCSFAVVFLVMNTVENEQGRLTDKFTSINTPSNPNTYLRDAYVENGALVIKDKFTDIKVFQKDGRVQFFDDTNKALTPQVKKYKSLELNENGQEVSVERYKIYFNEEKYKRYSFNILRDGMLELEYNHEDIRIIKYPIVFVGDTYKSPGITGKLFDIVKIPRLHALDGYETLGSMRIYNWTRTLPLLKETMYLGYGPDTFSIVFPQNDTFGKTISYGMANIVVDKPHNMYLQIAVNTGIISLVVFVIGLFIYLLDGIVAYRGLEKISVEAFLWLGVLAYHATAMFNDSLVSVAPIAWICFGISAGIIYSNREEEKSLNTKEID